MAGKSPRWKFEPTDRHVRVAFNGEFVADSKNVMLMIESPHELHYYFPEDDVRMDLLEPTDHVEHSGYRGDAHHFTVKVGDDSAENAAWTYPDEKEGRPDLRGYIAFDWRAMDAWYEEDEQVYVHPRNPYHRVDTIRSSRHVRVDIDGVTVAETERPYLLFETGLPTRYYVPPEDVRADLLIPTEKHTRCPYKGLASYWSVKIGDEVHENVVWGYPDPIAENPKLTGLMAFYNERVDLYVDGELQKRPRTVFA